MASRQLEVFGVTFTPKELGPGFAVVESRRNDSDASVFSIQMNGDGEVLK